ncbi:MAG: polysaccharide biosynthesis protein [Hyphomicrobiaceae bacterium]
MDSRQASDELARLREWLIDLPRPWKRAILAVNDFLLLTLAVWLAISLRHGKLYIPQDIGQTLLLLAAPASGVAIFAWFGLYRLVTRYITIRGSSRLLMCVGLSILLWGMLALLLGAHWLPRSVIAVLYPLIGGGLIFASRQFYAAALRTVGLRLPRPGEEPRPVVIYGTGRTAVQLIDALHNAREARVVGLLDDNPSLRGQIAGGVKIYRPDKLTRLIEREAVREVILALPEHQRRERKQILKQLERFPVRVKTLPAIEDFASGRASYSELRPVDVEDLLGRDPAPADPRLLTRTVAGKSVMVTGAGGSIGSELVRQILKHGPERLVLFELSEVALYEIQMEVTELIALMPTAARPASVVAVLGSVQDDEFVRRVIEDNKVATIYHAAAYKHVPIVEHNPVAGLANNTFGTEVVAAAARGLGVERFVLISTDKAVRPTSVMGCSKRLAEMILQAHAADGDCRTIFTMVRFGNVLDSSGSVVRLFRKQIQAGGPVTVTHPEMIRYFMSIPEAAGLVLQAGAMATGGEVFVLDMGEPVKIDDLARSMIRLMGLEVRDENNPDADIQINYVGLRPGEKLYEELLIGENTMPTEHPLIRRCIEPHPTTDELMHELDVLAAAMEASSREAVDAVLSRIVEEYRPGGGGATETAALPLAPASRTLH